MKVIISMFLVLSLFSSCKGQKSADNSENDWVVNKLAGKVKQIKEITYNGDDMSKTIKGALEINYNGDGYITQIYSHGIYENTDPTTTKVYDSNNKLIKITFYDSDNNELEKIIYTHSKGGKEIDKKIVSKSSNIEFSEKVILKYNEANQMVGSQTIQDGKVRSTLSIKDSAGQKITEEKLLDSKGKPHSRTVKKYDKRKNLLEKYEYGGNDGNSLDFKVIFKYDDKNNPVEIIKYYGDGSIRYQDSSEYLYDKTGNWIKKTDFRDNHMTEVTERKIQYY